MLAYCGHFLQFWPLNQISRILSSKQQSQIVVLVTTRPDVFGISITGSYSCRYNVRAIFFLFFSYRSRLRVEMQKLQILNSNTCFSCLTDHIVLSNLLTIEPRMVIILWACHGPILSQQISLWCSQVQALFIPLKFKRPVWKSDHTKSTYLKVRVESSNLHFLGVWYLELTKFHPKFKLLKAWQILKLSILVWQSVEEGCSKRGMKGSWH